MLSERSTPVHIPARLSKTQAWSIVRARAHLIALAGLLVLYLLISLHNLTVSPLVHQDEPWIASTGWKLATDGLLGSDMFTGFYGMERHYYEFMPVQPILLAATFRVIGVGLFQARLENVIAGLVVLGLTYALGRRLFNPIVGVLGVMLLLFVRTTALSPTQVTGIAFLDVARIARYDIIVPLFGLAALHAYISSRKGNDSRFSLLAGLLAALAGLSHIYGAAWIVALGLLALWDGRSWKVLAAMASGFALPWLAYTSFVLAHPDDWLGQLRLDESRFDLFSAAWYWNNLIQEPIRYSPGLVSSFEGWITRPGFWIAAIGIAASLFGLAVRALRDRDVNSRTLLVPAIVLPALFALLIDMKRPAYLATVYPLFAIASAWAVMTLWRWATRQPFGAAVRSATLILAVAIVVEASVRIAAIELRQPPGSYTALIEQVREEIPAGARTLGMHNYWFGLEDHDYRTWYVPVVQTQERYWSPPLTIEQALDRVTPEAILIDPKIQEYFTLNPSVKQAVHRWMDDHGFVLVRVIDDPSYGRVEIYRLRT